MKIIWTLVISVILLIIVFVIAVYSGIYNVAATQPHTKLTEWVLTKTLAKSVKYRARQITVPKLNDESVLKVGSVSYDEMCATCHGSPGLDPSVIGEGLYPKPPDLAESVKGLTLAEIFWITKNGLKMTGMPAFGPTHTDDELWDVVLFVQKLPDISPEDYAILTETTGGKKGQNHNHDHEMDRQSESDNAQNYNDQLENQGVKSDHSPDEIPNNDEENVHMHESGKQHYH